MRAFSRNELGPILAGAVTAVLGLFFWSSTGSERIALTPHFDMEGKTWILKEDMPKKPALTPAEPGASAASSNDNPAAGSFARSKRSTKRRRSRGNSTAEGAHPGGGSGARSTTEAVSVSTDAPKSGSAEPIPSSPASAKATVLPGTLGAAQEHTLQEVMDNFEADPSKYPMDRAATVDGITLCMRGLQRRGNFFVLKVAVANSTDSDFFVKDFAPQAGSTVLAGRSFFRILVEPRREREGYVVFEKPRAGAAVHINLKEDGGKGRAVGLQVPYSF